MPITIGSNIASLMAQRRLVESTNSVTAVLERLSSGMRINKGADDPAGISLSSKLSLDARILTQAIRNVSDGSSVLNIAEGALRELSAITIRQKELAEQAANGTYTFAQRKAMDSEADKLTSEFNRIVETTSFNGVKLLNTRSQLVIQAGTGSRDTILLEQNAQFGRTVGSGSYNPTVSYGLGAGASPEAVTLVDVNKDGILDYVEGNTGVDALGIGLGNGDGTFRAPTNYGSIVNPFYMATGDFNNDGNIDIAAAPAGTTSAAIHYGNGNGSFRAPQILSLLSGSQHVVTGDFDGNGWDDIAFGTTTTGAVNLFLNNGGSFGAAITTAVGSTSLRELAAGDFNGDGKDDIATVNFDNGTVSILSSNGDGRFSILSNLSVGSGPGAIDIADINHDGIMDIAVAGSSTSLMSVFLGNGNGSFLARKTFQQLDDFSESIRVVDMNGDGNADIVQGIRSGTVSAVTIYHGNGDGSFNAFVSVATGNTPVTVAVGDLDRNGSMDIVTSDRGIDAIGVLLQNTTQVTTAQRIRLFTREEALSSLGVLDATLQRINQELGSLGGQQSRLMIAHNTLSTSVENYRAAAGRIQDADTASESAELVRKQIAQRAAISVLAQANVLPELALTLLRG